MPKKYLVSSEIKDKAMKHCIPRCWNKHFSQIQNREWKYVGYIASFALILNGKVGQEVM